MNRLVTVAAMMLAAGSIASAQGGVEKALIDLEHQWVKASIASKGADLMPLLAADFVTIDSDGGMHTRAEYVARTNKSKWQVSAVSDMKVQVYGDSAVVTGIWTGKGTDGSGKQFDGRERFADTWVKMKDGTWQCVASVSAPLP